MTLFVFLVPLWLFGVIFPPTMESDRLELMQFGCFIWLPLFGAVIGKGRFVFGSVFSERLSILALTITSLLAFAASALLSDEPLRSLGFVSTVGVGLICCAGIWDIIGSRMSSCLSIYSILGTVIAVYAYSAGARIQGRLTIGDAHPNYLGLISFGFLMCALAMRSRIYSGLLIAVNLFVIVDTQSRSALAAALLGLLIYASLKAHQIQKRKAAFSFAGIALLLAVLWLTYYEAIEQWVSSLFFLYDKYRGLGTGFTGRLGAWYEALDLFYGNPALGVGFRMHERYMTMLSSAHNGYLSLLAEVGLFGAIPLLALTLLACWRLLRRALAGDPISTLGFSFVIGYAFLVVFERLFLNMGNPTSILVWLFLLVSGRVQRASAASPPLLRWPVG